MNPVLGVALLAATAVAGGIAIARVMTWSSSPARRRRLAAKAHARTMARHRADRRTT
jgi:hypothetical protein